MNVLIVDDQPSARTMLRHVIEGISPEIRVDDFGDPIQALSWSEHSHPDLLLLDYRMPNLDGLEFARRFRRPLSHRDVPIVLITVVGDEPIRQAALDSGVMDFMVKPIRPRELRSRCRNLLALRQQSQTVKQRVRALERQALASMQELEEREREIVILLARANEYRHGGGSQIERMARFCGVIAEGIGLPDDDVRMIELAAPLHDIGKLGIPDAILLKPGELNQEETALMRSHVLIGQRILGSSTNKLVQLGATMAFRHHERFDGSGYPDGLAGEQIPIAARIVAIADVLDALMSDRPYKPAWSLDDALAYLLVHRGTHFDPQCVDALVRGRDRLDEICAAYSGSAVRSEHS